MAHQVLDIFNVEYDFFADSKLFAIGTQLPGYALCSLFNSLFAVALAREDDIEIFYTPKKSKTSLTGSLFDGLLPEPGQKPEATPFQLFRFAYDKEDDEDVSVLVYENRNEGRNLIPEVGQANFLILIRNISRIHPESDLSPYLKQLADIDWVSELNPYEIKSRSNLLL